MADEIRIKLVSVQGYARFREASFHEQSLRVRFLIGCSDKLADVDIRLYMYMWILDKLPYRVIWAIWLGPGNDCSRSDIAPRGLDNFRAIPCIVSRGSISARTYATRIFKDMGSGYLMSGSLQLNPPILADSRLFSTIHQTAPSQASSQ